MVEIFNDILPINEKIATSFLHFCVQWAGNDGFGVKENGVDLSLWF